MAQRPGPIKRTPSREEDKFNKTFVSGGGFGGNRFKKMLDPAGAGDAWFGGEFERPDSSEIDIENDRLEDELFSSVPNTYHDVEYQGDYRAPEAPRSEMDDIYGDPRTREYRLAALQQLEEQGREGLTLQDRANRARLDGDVNRENAGRMGAIQQNMAARGAGGSGMELVAQMMGAQAGTDRQARNSLETAAAGEAQRRAAIQGMGTMAGQMQSQDFNEAQAKAQANDAIKRFNAANSAEAGQRNADTRQVMANHNALARNKFETDNFQNKASVSGIKYNNNANKLNEAKVDWQNQVNANEKKKDGIVKTAGTVLGSIFGKGGF